MATAALGRRAKRAGVVLVGVAILAGGALCGKAAIYVAGGALQGRMLAEQRELRQVVIEADIGLPSGAGVTARAVLSEPLGMDIVFRMTGAALRGKLGFRGALRMAILALRLGVGAGQGKIGHRVVIEIR